MRALIGYSGFVGSSLLRQTGFDATYRSSNIAEITGQHFDLIICAGAQAKKWMANKDPEWDLAGLNALMEPLKSVSCERFVLISTVDVYADPVGVSESTPPKEDGLHAYGKHRLMLERFCAQQFATCHILRLAGLVGPGLSKNVIYDFHHDNNLEAIDARNRLQYYPMVNLWDDIETTIAHDLPLVHLTAEPLSSEEVARHGFHREFTHTVDKPTVTYDMQSEHATLFGGQGGYQYSKRESLMAIRAYAQSEPKKVEG